MLQSRKFYDAGAIRYDRMIINKYLQGRSPGFSPDPVISALTFSSQVIPDPAEICHGGSLTRGVSSVVPSKQRSRRGTNQTRKPDEVPADFPSEICFFYNYRQCWEDNCSKAHICRRCSGKDRADSCRVSKKS